MMKSEPNAFAIVFHEDDNAYLIVGDTFYRVGKVQWEKCEQIEPPAGLRVMRIDEAAAYTSLSSRDAGLDGDGKWRTDIIFLNSQHLDQRENS